MAYKLVIFDFDGTLADSADWMRRTINQLAERYDFKRIADDEFETLHGRDNRAIVRHLGVPAWKMPLIAIVTSNAEENVRRILGPENAGLISYYECGASIFDKTAKFR